MERFVDGLQIQKLASFAALMKRLGLEKNPTKRNLSMNMDRMISDGETLTRPQASPGLRGEYLTGFEVWRWKEFQLFCIDLGVPWSKATVSIRFDVGEGDAPNITQVYRAEPPDTICDIRGAEQL